MTNTNAKRTTLETLGKVAKHANRKEPYYYGEDEEYVIMYHPTFSQTKRTKLVQELLKTMTYVEENKLDALKTDEQINEYVTFLIIKYFTELYDMLEGQSFQVHIEVMNQLKDSSLMELLINEAFNFEELDKINFDLQLVENRMKTLNAELESAAQLSVLSAQKPGLVDLALKAQNTKGKKKK